MLKNVLPEQVGIRSEYVYKFLNTFEKRQLHLHSLLLVRGEDIILEAYRKPFDKDVCIR